MMVLNNNGRVPPGGWTHKEDTGMEFPIDGNHRIADLDQLLDEVRDYRQGTGGDLEIGWRDRFIDELCRKHPSYPCVHEAPFMERRLTLADAARFLNTAKRFLDAGGKFVEQEEAERRSEVCSRCPYNVQLAGCAGCNGLMTFAFDMIAGKKTSRDSELRSCQACACTLAVKVWVPLEVIDNDGVGPFPDWCWQKSELNPTGLSQEQDTGVPLQEPSVSA